MELIFNIIICDDDMDFLDIIYKKVSDIMSESGFICNIIELYNAKELLDYCRNNTVDIILTDIDMPDKNDLKVADITNTEGFMAAQKIQILYPNIKIVFVSSHEELAYQAFSYRPFSFVSKRDLQRLDEDLSELINKIKLQKNNNILFPLNVAEKTHMINVRDTIYFKIEKHYIRAYNINGKGLSYRCGIKDAYKQLVKADFIYLHRSYLINCRYIKHFDTQNVIMINNEKISVTRDEKRLREAQEIFARYRRRLR